MIAADRKPDRSPGTGAQTASSTTAADEAGAEARSTKLRALENAQAGGRQVVEAERAAVAAKTAQLRELRLAKEERDRIAAEIRRARRQR